MLTFASAKHRHSYSIAGYVCVCGRVRPGPKR